MQKQLVFGLLLSWIITFFIAAKDTSEALTTLSPGQFMTMRTWLWIEGSLTLLMLIFLSIYLFSESQLLKKFMIVPTFFKLGFTVLGFFIFQFWINYDECSDILKDYLIVYFAWFTYVIITFTDNYLTLKSKS